jgi:hypothetical protein
MGRLEPENTNSPLIEALSSGVFTERVRKGIRSGRAPAHTTFPGVGVDVRRQAKRVVGEMRNCQRDHQQSQRVALVSS